MTSEAEPHDTCLLVGGGASLGNKSAADRDSDHAPCWVALVGRYLYSSNSPSHSISRYVVTGSRIVLDAPVAAMTSGAPTDIGSSGKIVAVLDGGAQTHLTQFEVGDDGALRQLAVSIVNRGANGVAVIGR